MLWIDQDAKLVDINPSAAKLLGWEREQLAEFSLFEVAIDLSAESWCQFWQRLQNDRCGRVETCARRPDGKRVELELAADLLDVSDEKVAFVILTDIGQRKQAEEDLRYSESIQRSIMESTPDSVLLLDINETILFINRTVPDLTPAQVIGTPLSNHLDDEGYARARRCFRSVRESGQPDYYEVDYHAPDGTVSTWESRVAPVFMGDSITGMTVFARNVTEQRQAERSLHEMKEQLARVSRLSTVGELAAGIAHEINQPLTSIANYVAACQKIIQDSGNQFREPILDWLQDTSDQAVRCGKIIHGFRGLAQNSSTGKAPVRINTLIEETVRLLQSERVDPVQVSRALAQPGPEVVANRVQLQQVIINLLRNAREASLPDEESEIRIEVANGDALATIIIEDNGTGISPPDRDKLFDAFFTTKSDGLGMGLAVSRSIMEAHDGNLRFEPREPNGSRFLIELPVSH